MPELGQEAGIDLACAHAAAKRRDTEQPILNNGGLTVDVAHGRPRPRHGGVEDPVLGKLCLKQAIERFAGVRAAVF